VRCKIVITDLFAKELQVKTTPAKRCDDTDIRPSLSHIFSLPFPFGGLAISSNMSSSWTIFSKKHEVWSTAMRHTSSNRAVEVAV